MRFRVRVGFSLRRRVGRFGVEDVLSFQDGRREQEARQGSSEERAQEAGQRPLQGHLGERRRAQGGVPSPGLPSPRERGRADPEARPHGAEHEGLAARLASLQAAWALQEQRCL